MTAFKQFLFGEWYFAVPMLGLSFVAFTLVFWRLLLNLDARTSLKWLLNELQAHLSHGGVEAALPFCRGRPEDMACRLCVAGLLAAKQGPGVMRRAMEEVIEHDLLPKLNFLLPPILAIAKIATMLGLLGTVISMIHTFTLLSEAENKAAAPVQAGAIGLALFATALGLMIAVPLVFAHVLLKAFVHRFELKMRYTAEKLLDLVHPPPVPPDAHGPGAEEPVTAPGPEEATAEAPVETVAPEADPIVNPGSP